VFKVPDKTGCTASLEGEKRSSTTSRRATANVLLPRPLSALLMLFVVLLSVLTAGAVEEGAMASVAKVASFLLSVMTVPSRSG
jgi:hypothetical protein